MRNSELIKLLYKIEPQAGLSKEEFIIKEITKLQVLFAAEMKRNEKKKIITYGDLEKIVLNNSTYVTYLEAVRNLKINIRLLSNLSYLKENIVNLENKAIGSSIERLRIGLAPNMSENEYKLENFRLRAKLLLLHNIEIKKVSEITGVKVSTIKQACQSDRLLNTWKVGNNWMVNLHEVRHYWELIDSEK